MSDGPEQVAADRDAAKRGRDRKLRALVNQYGAELIDGRTWTGDRRRWELKVLGLPTLQKKQHHMMTHRERKRWRHATIWALKQAGVRRPIEPLISRATVTFTRHSAAHLSGVADDDNLSISFKAHRDALVGWLIEDDKPAVLRALYCYGSAPPRGGFVRMVIEEGWGDACPMCGRANDES